MTEYNLLRNLAHDATKILFICGAGLSQESGISPYRGSTVSSTESRTIPITRQDYLNNRDGVISHFKALKTLVSSKLPNQAHYDLKNIVDLLKLQGKEVMVCTQNIDGFEKKVGLDNVIQLHGNLDDVDLDKASKGDLSGIVLTGDIIDKNVMDAVTDFFSECDLLVMIGTSGEMLPWAIFPITITKSGSPFIYINLDATKISPHATVFCQSVASEALNGWFNAILMVG
jgi:NAD-dependent deacetylase